MKYPHRRAYSHFIEGGDIYLFYRHGPAVHCKASAPPEAQCAFGSFGAFKLYYDSTRPVRFLIRDPLRCSETGEIDDGPGPVLSLIPVGIPVDYIVFLRVKDKGCIGSEELYEAEGKVARGKKV